MTHPIFWRLTGKRKKPVISEEFLSAAESYLCMQGYTGLKLSLRSCLPTDLNWASVSEGVQRKALKCTKAQQDGRQSQQVSQRDAQLPATYQQVPKWAAAF